MPVSTKAPQAVFINPTAKNTTTANPTGNPPSDIFAFPPNRATLGGTAYLIGLKGAGEKGNILVDCPAFNQTNQEFIAEQGGISILFITHRGGMAQVSEFQKAFGCTVIIQEQEAYLLPTITPKTFHRDHRLFATATSRAFWTPGHSPGSSCLYHSHHGGILFTGRHLIPTSSGVPQPLRLSKTFHWPRQLKYSQQLLIDFTPQTLSYICPGASTGFLRGKKKIDNAYAKLQSVDWEALKSAQPIL